MMVSGEVWTVVITVVINIVLASMAVVGWLMMISKADRERPIEWGQVYGLALIAWSLFGYMAFQAAQLPVGGSSAVSRCLGVAFPLVIALIVTVGIVIVKVRQKRTGGADISAQGK